MDPENNKSFVGFTVKSSKFQFRQVSSQKRPQFEPENENFSGYYRQKKKAFDLLLLFLFHPEKHAKSKSWKIIRLTWGKLKVNARERIRFTAPGDYRDPVNVCQATAF